MQVSPKKYLYLLLMILLLFLSFTFLNKTKKDYKTKREQMVKLQIKQRGISNVKLLEVLKIVPRHYFVLDKYKKYAYEDSPLPIGFGQTISQPYIVALMTELINVNKNSNVLEVGTGSGYQAAVLSKLVKNVYTIEIVKQLRNKAAAAFQKAGYTNIKIKHGDGYFGWQKYAPYDAIIVTCAASFIPPPLVKQLRVGGIMCIPVGPPFQVQNLLLVKRISKKDVKVEIITQVRFVPLVRSKD